MILWAFEFALRNILRVKFNFCVQFFFVCVCSTLDSRVRKKVNKSLVFDDSFELLRFHTYIVYQVSSTRPDYVQIQCNAISLLNFIPTERRKNINTILFKLSYFQNYLGWLKLSNFTVFALWLRIVSSIAKPSKTNYDITNIRARSVPSIPLYN